LCYPIQSTRAPERLETAITQVYYTIIRGSSIRQSERLLTVRLWVRVPPPELLMTYPNREERVSK
jgi:hypothetical protein